MPSNNPVIFNSVADRNMIFNTLEAKWSIIDRLYQGTDSMRAAGEELLPKGENEEQTVYNERLAESTLEPLYRQAVDMTVDLIVNEDIEVTGSNGSMTDFFDDVDGSGTDLTQFSEQLIKLAIHYGIAYAVVDYPSEEQADGRPFLSAINPRNVLGFDTERVNGQEVLTDVRFFETVSKEDDLTVQNTDTISDINEVRQGIFADTIRRYELDTETNTVTYTIYTRKKSDLKWVEQDKGVMQGLTRIPMIPVYGNKDSYFIGTPLYYDAAQMNIKLWRTQSIQDYALKFNRYPAYIVTGIGAANRTSPDNPNDFAEGEEQSTTANQVKIPYGPGSIIGTPNTEVSILKFDGQAEPLTLGFEDIDRTRRAIKENAPVLMLTELSGNITATATAIQSAQAGKTVRKVARNYTNSLMQISSFVAAYYTVTGMPTFEINSMVLNPEEPNV